MCSSVYAEIICGLKVSISLFLLLLIVIVVVWCAVNLKLSLTICRLLIGEYVCIGASFEFWRANPIVLIIFASQLRLFFPCSLFIFFRFILALLYYEISFLVAITEFNGAPANYKMSVLISHTLSFRSHPQICWHFSDPMHIHTHGIRFKRFDAALKRTCMIIIFFSCVLNDCRVRAQKRPSFPTLIWSHFIC